ncbi:hypothetical protein FQA39_LY07296 [Lamprigera yunnana]|nr:hypothetical protein FQA39_LY07296 [Lamprigera yunnana]
MFSSCTSKIFKLFQQKEQERDVHHFEKTEDDDDSIHDPNYEALSDESSSSNYEQTFSKHVVGDSNLTETPLENKFIMGGHTKIDCQVPDYRTYKVEDAPDLVKVQKALAARGLRDPWLRNEVWRFSPKLYGTKRHRVMLTLSRGFTYGLAAAVVTVLGTHLLSPADDHGSHH